jgi:multidrug efflux pump subunit AcrB
MDLISLVVRRKLLVHLMVLILVVLGLWHYADMPRNFFPNAHMNQAWVVVPWPGASPLEVERQITDKLESAVADLEGLDELQSRSQQSKSVVGVFIEEGRDMDKVMMDLQTSVNSVTDLPEDALDPIFLEIDASMVQPVCLIAMGGPLEENILLEVAEDMKKEFENVPGVKSIDLSGLRDLEVRVSVDLDLLEHYRLSMGEILAAIGRQNVDFPGGKSEVAGRTQSLRVLGKYRDLQDIGDTVLRISPQGGVLRLKQLATVDLEIEDQHVLSRLNGEPSGTMIVFKTNEGNTLDIMDEVHLIVERYNSSLPIPVFTEVRLDTAELIRERLGIMTNNAWLTAILVGVLLLFFLGWSNSLLVLFGIPFTFLVGFIFMNMAGMSINMLTLFAMIMALGIIVDDAIVVVDNVQRHIERGLDPARAAIVGTREVMGPVVSAVLTTVAGFMPVLFMTGMIGKFMSAIPKTIIFVLLASLVEALLVLPAHTAEISELNRHIRRRIGLKQRSVEGRGRSGSVKRNPVSLLLRKTYRKRLAFTLRHRYLALTSVVILAVASMGLLSVLPVRMFPSEDFDQITLQFEAPTGTPLEETDLLTRELENLISQLPTEEVKAVVSSSGHQARNYESGRDQHRPDFSGRPKP